MQFWTDLNKLNHLTKAKSQKNQKKYEKKSVKVSPPSLTPCQIPKFQPK